MQGAALATCGKRGRSTPPPGWLAGWRQVLLLSCLLRTNCLHHRPQPQINQYPSLEISRTAGGGWRMENLWVSQTHIFESFQLALRQGSAGATGGCPSRQLYHGQQKG